MREPWLGDSKQSAHAAELGQRSLRRDSSLRLSVSAGGLKHRVFLHPHAWAVSVSAMRRAMHRSLTAPPALGAPAAGGGSDTGVTPARSGQGHRAASPPPHSGWCRKVVLATPPQRRAKLNRFTVVVLTERGGRAECVVAIDAMQLAVY